MVDQFLDRTAVVFGRRALIQLSWDSSGLFAAGPAGKCKTDYNRNGVDDAIDISTGTSVDLIGRNSPVPNGVPDECDRRRLIEDGVAWRAFRVN